MKKIILSLTLVAFAVVPALQAGEDECCPKAKAATPAQQVSCPSQKATCPADQAKCEKPKSCCTDACKEACGAKKAKVVKRTNPSVKGAQLLVKR